MASQNANDPALPIKMAYEAATKYIKAKLKEMYQALVGGLSGNWRAQNTLFGLIVGGAIYKATNYVARRPREAMLQRSEERKGKRDIKRKDRKAKGRHAPWRGKTLTYEIPLNKVHDLDRVAQRAGIVVYATKTKYGTAKIFFAASDKERLSKALKERQKDLVQDKKGKDIDRYQRARNTTILRAEEFKIVKSGIDINKELEKAGVMDKDGKVVMPRHNSYPNVNNAKIEMSRLDYCNNKAQIDEIATKYGGEVTLSKGTPPTICIYLPRENSAKMMNEISQKANGVVAMSESVAPTVEQNSYNLALTMSKDDFEKFVSSCPPEVSMSYYENADGSYSVYVNEENLMANLPTAQKNINAFDEKDMQQQLENAYDIHVKADKETFLDTKDIMDEHDHREFD